MRLSEMGAYETKHDKVDRIMEIGYDDGDEWKIWNWKDKDDKIDNFLVYWLC